jgi:hypothetical protein
MKSETLRSLLIDKELGELAPEAVELLDAYLVAVPEVKSQADLVARTIHTARKTVRRFPELVATPSTTSVTSHVEVIRHWFAPSLAYAAALIAVGGIAAWLGFHAGVSRQGVDTKVTVTRAPDHRYEGLWAKYQVAYDSRRGAFVVAQP